MIEVIITYLNTLLKDLIYTDKTFGLVERKEEDGGKVYPVANIKGVEKQVLDLSPYQAVSYHRILEASQPVKADQQTRMNDIKWEYTYSMRMVTFVRHKNLGSDAYDSIRLGESLVVATNFLSNKTLKNTLSASSVEVQVLRVVHDTDTIVAAEVSGVDFRVTSEWVGAMVDYEIRIRILQSCLEACTTAEILVNYIDCAGEPKTAKLGEVINCGEITPCPEATAENSLGTEIASGVCGTPLVIADSAIKKSDGVLIANVPAETPYNVADSIVSNSDDTYLVNVKATEALELPDVNNIDSNLAVVPTPAQTVFVATPCVACPDIDDYTCTELNDPTTGLTQTQRDFIQKVSPGKTGQTVSYVANDDGDLELGRQAAFLTLTCNNPLGNTDRFTDHGDGTVTDWLWRKMWSKTYRSPDLTWANAIIAAEASALGGHTDWHLPNIMEHVTILNFGLAAMLNYAPFNTIANNLWTSTTVPSATTTAFTVWQSIGVSTLTKVTSSFYFICRNI